MKSPYYLSTSKTLKFASACAAIIFFISLFILSFNLKMFSSLNHDEHQFVASGSLLANKSLLPYRDYPYHHMPNLVFIYAAIFKCTNYLLLSSRAFSVLCGVLCCALLSYSAVNIFRHYNVFVRFFIGIGSALLLFTSPLFITATGFAWDQDLPVFFGLIATILYCRAATQRKAWGYVFFSGLFIGLAIGTRISFALTAIPFLCAIFLFPSAQTKYVKIRLLFVFIGGFFLAMMPSLMLFLMAPKQFIHGVINYHFITLRFVGLPGKDTIGPFGKFSFFITKILFPIKNLLLFAGFAFFVIFKTIIKAKATVYNAFEVFFISSVAVFLLIFSILSTPSHEKYFYTPIPFIILGILYAVAFLITKKEEKIKLAVVVFIILYVTNFVTNKSRYFQSPFKWISRYRQTIPIQIHDIGVEMADAVHDGKVLTLAPIFPLEGKLDIYEEFATGPFMWRTADLVDKKDRKRLRIISENELDSYLTKKPPVAIFIGFEGGLEKPMFLYAQKNRFKKQVLANHELWVSPVVH